MENTIRVLKVEPGKVAYVKEIVDDFKVIQSEVGGDMDCFDTEDGCVVVHNAVGKNKRLEPNRRYGNDIICGPFFICAEGEEGEFISLTDEQIEKYSKQFAEIEQFSGQEPELAGRMTLLSL